jgi:histone-lysine N-methyltransferase SUV39H
MFAALDGQEEKELYVVDGEFIGSPTKFIHYSCEPICRQYTVNYNTHDGKVLSAYPS